MGYSILGKLTIFATLAGGVYDAYLHASNFLSNGQDLQNIHEQAVQLKELAPAIENCFKTCTNQVSIFSSDAYCHANCQIVRSLYAIAADTHNGRHTSALRNFEASQMAAIAAIGITVYFTYPIICKAASRILQSFAPPVFTPRK